MVQPPIPRWLAALDERKPYIEVLDGERQPDVSPYDAHGQLAIRVGAQLDAWAGDRGRAGVEVRFYFLRADGRWSSVLPDVDYISEKRLPGGWHDEALRPRIAPDIAVEILSPNDRPGRMQRKVDLYLEFGSTAVLVLHPKNGPSRSTAPTAPSSTVTRAARGRSSRSTASCSTGRKSTATSGERAQRCIVSARRYAFSASRLKQQKIVRSGTSESSISSRTVATAISVAASSG
jgi:Uma2 family endonuclease